MTPLKEPANGFDRALTGPAGDEADTGARSRSEAFGVKARQLSR